MPVPDHRLAICRRCRQPERIAKGADSAEDLLVSARAYSVPGSPDLHVRLSQCLNCCDGGHTVRVEWKGTEIALVGMRTVEELQCKVLENLEQIAKREVPDEVENRVYQVWVDGELRWHKNLDEGEES